MNQKSKKHISIINNILRKSSTQISRLNLFNQHKPQHSFYHDIYHDRLNSPVFKNQFKRLNKYNHQMDQPKDIPVGNSCIQCNSRLLSDPQLQQPIRHSDILKKQKIKKSSNKLPTPEDLLQNNIRQKKRMHQSQQSKIQSPNIVKIVSEKHSNQAVPRRVNYNKYIWSIPYKDVKSFFKSNSVVLQKNTQPEQLYAKLYPFCQKNSVYLPSPLIKQYRNCTYFGETIIQNKKHQGFLIFPQCSKVYYGQLINEKKYGMGIQIDFLNNIVYQGRYEHGKKIGKFTIIKQTEKYIGQIKDNQYHGQGKLFTNNSIYKGQFQGGCRHGQGQQFYPETGLSISGTFIYNSFTNNSSRIEESRIQKHKRKSRIVIEKKNDKLQEINNPEEIQDYQKIANNSQNYNQNTNKCQRYTVVQFRQTHWNKNILYKRDKGPIGHCLTRKKSIEEQDPLKSRM